MLVVVLALEAYLFANAVYALASPENFLTNRWTRVARVGTGDSNWRYQNLRSVLARRLVFLGFCASKLILRISGIDENYRHPDGTSDATGPLKTNHPTQYFTT